MAGFLTNRLFWTLCKRYVDVIWDVTADIDLVLRCTFYMVLLRNCSGR